jgi:serine protease AprX
VALIDTGVVPVDGLTAGNVANGPDLSLESQLPGLLRRDSYGHGTHLAGIIAGHDPVGGPFQGIAPDAKLLSIKVGSANGAVDATQVLAAIDWVVVHRKDDPANPIKVLNLSYGTDGIQNYTSSPLSAAVHNAVEAGITVVVASGNTGGTMLIPGYTPFVITAGATDPQGTTNPADDKVASFSSQGNAGRHPDIMAPGRSIVSLRDPGSYADVNFPAARVGDRFFKGSGTSQAAAVVSGAAAVLLQKYPNANQATIDCYLQRSGSAVVGATVREVNLQAALAMAPVTCNQPGSVTHGSGMLQYDRGTSVVTFGDSTALTGERDIFGPLSSTTWELASTAHTSWSGGDWMGHPWTGTGWAAAANGQAKGDGGYLGRGAPHRLLPGSPARARSTAADGASGPRCSGHRSAGVSVPSIRPLFRTTRRRQKLIRPPCALWRTGWRPASVQHSFRRLPTRFSCLRQASYQSSFSYPGEEMQSATRRDRAGIAVPAKAPMRGIRSVDCHFMASCAVDSDVVVSRLGRSSPG